MSSLNPASPPVVNGNQKVAVVGSNFQAGLTVDVFNSAGSKLGTLSGTQIESVTATTFTMVVNLGGSAGTFGIEVVNPDGKRSARFTFSTVAQNPTVSSINPASPPVVNGNQNVGVVGSNFQADLTVDVFNAAGSKLGTLSGSQVLNVTATTFTMVVNLGSSAGSFGIEVVNPDGKRSARFTFSTVAQNPTVTSINPASPPVVNGNQNVGVVGSNFQADLTVDVYNAAGSKLGTLSGTQVLNVTATTFTMVVNLGSSAGSFGIEVVNPDGKRSARFTFSTVAQNPTVTSINPASPPVVNGNQNVGVVGSHFQSGLTVDVYNAAGSKLGTLSGTQVLNVTATTFTMVVNLGSSAGSFGIEVVNPDGKRSARFSFSTVAQNPTVNSINPASPPVVNGDQNVGVVGSNFQAGLTIDVYNAAGSKLGTLSGTQVLNVTATTFTMVVNLGGSAGSFGIEVVNPDGKRSARFSFSTVAQNPTVTSINPASPPVVNGNQNVGVVGSHFQSGLTVDVYNAAGSKLGTLSGTQVLNVTATTFTMVINLGGSAGSFGIEVVNPDGKRSARFTFSTVAQNPTVSSINPASPPVVNGNQNVGVVGSNFQSGLTVDVYNSAGSKLGTLSGTQVLSVTTTTFTMVINLGGSAGSFGIEVVNPDGKRSPRFTFSTH